MEGHTKNRKATKKDGHVPIELTTITNDHEEPNDRRQLMSKDVDVQTELTASMLDDLERNDRRQVLGKCVDAQTEPIAITFDDEGTNDRLQLVREAIEIESDSPSRNASDDPMTKNRRVVDTTIAEPIRTTTNTIDDIKADLSPIVGYADEHLLPLFKACDPLTNVVHNISFYVQIALRKTPELPPDGLTIDESAVIRLYTMEWDKPHHSLYSMLNHTLKKDLISSIENCS
jgi:hypothetical protein